MFEEFRPLDEQMSDAERRRLLYVACTRAVDHLVVSLHRKPEKVEEGTAKATSATVLAEAGAAGHGAVASVDRAAVAEPPAPVQPLSWPWADQEQWDAERRAGTGRRRPFAPSTSATRLAHDAPVAAELRRRPADDPGLRKEGVDLDLPPWQRGRYGTAIGRAVHAVLQDVDLAGRRGHRAAARRAVRRRGHLRVRVDGRRAVPLGARRADRAPAASPAPSTGASCSSSPSSVSTVLEGYVDLLVRTAGRAGDRRLQDRPAGRRRRAAARLERYRRQLAAYGVALGRLLAEPIAGGIIVRCRTDGPAEEVPVGGWAEAMQEGSATLLAG